MVLKKASETPLCLEGNLLKVSDVFEPTHDRSILLAKNLNPKTSKETFQHFVEAKKRVDVFNIVYGKGDKAIVILKSEIGRFMRPIFYGCSTYHTHPYIFCFFGYPKVQLKSLEVYAEKIKVKVYVNQQNSVS